MSYSGGVFSINTTGQPVVAGTTISASVFNALTSDLATGLSTCILKDGTQTTTAAIPFAAGILGVTTNSSAATGVVGEYIESIVSAGNFGTTGQYSDRTSISLTAGDWDVTGLAEASANGATVTDWILGISTTSGNSGTGLVVGSNRLYSPGPTGSYDTSLTIAGYRMSLSGTTTVYLKLLGDYSVATPTVFCRLSARRVR